MKREAKRQKQESCLCPYCKEETLISPLPYCQPCGVKLSYCSRCKIAVEREATVCPHCGGKLE